jgi:hypothetical protein
MRVTPAIEHGSIIELDIEAEQTDLDGIVAALAGTYGHDRFAVLFRWTEPNHDGVYVGRMRLVRPEPDQPEARPPTPKADRAIAYAAARDAHRLLDRVTCNSQPMKGTLYTVQGGDLAALAVAVDVLIRLLGPDLDDG